MSGWRTDWRAEQKLRRNEDVAIAQFEDQIRKIKEEAAPAIQRAMAPSEPRSENLLLSQRFEKTSHLSRCILNLQHARIQRTAHALGVHVAQDEIEKQFRPLFHLLTKDGKSRVECAIAEKRRSRRQVVITVALGVMGLIAAVVGIVHSWKH
jgi:hypothetical protein